MNKKALFIAGFLAIAISTLSVAPALACDDHANNQVKSEKKQVKYEKLTTEKKAVIAFKKGWFNKDFDIEGTITELSATTTGTSTITVKANNASSAIYTVDAAKTKIQKLNFKTDGTKAEVSNIAFADLKVGDTIRVKGKMNGTSIKAELIWVGIFPAVKTGKNFLGQVGTVTPDGFTLSSVLLRNGFATTTYTVKTASTTVFKNDNREASSTDITSGATVLVKGTLDPATKTITATKVQVITSFFRKIWRHFSWK